MGAASPKRRDKSTLRARSSVTGRFVPLAAAKRQPRTTIVERVKRRGA